MDFTREYVEIELSIGESTRVGDMIATVTGIEGEEISLLLEEIQGQDSTVDSVTALLNNRL